MAKNYPNGMIEAIAAKSAIVEHDGKFYCITHYPDSHAGWVVEYWRWDEKKKKLIELDENKVPEDVALELNPFWCGENEKEDDDGDE